METWNRGRFWTFSLERKRTRVIRNSRLKKGGFRVISRKFSCNENRRRFRASRMSFALTEVRGARVAGALARRALHANTQVNRRQGVCSTASLEAHARCRTSGRPPPRSPPGRETSVPDISRRTREGSRASRSTWRITPAPRWLLWPRATRNSGCVLSLVTRDSRAAAFPRGAPSRASRAPAQVSRFSSPSRNALQLVRFPLVPPASL